MRRVFKLAAVCLVAGVLSAPVYARPAGGDGPWFTRSRIIKIITHYIGVLGDGLSIPKP